MTGESVNLGKLTKSPSLAALRLSLRLKASGVVEFPCTGFLWAHDTERYLITNWHCVTGWHPVANRPMNSMGFWPEIVVANVLVGHDFTNATWREISIDLRDDDGRPLWLHHPSFGQGVDVVAIKLPSVIDTHLWSLPVNKVPQKPLRFMVADDAFVLGYPDVHAGGFPIWKRASIATEPELDHDSLPKILVDTATREGMSGAPVFAIQRGVHRREDKVAVIVGSGQRFLGVYSSRIGDELQGFQLGEVWKARVVEEIIQGGVAGLDPRS